MQHLDQADGTGTLDIGGTLSDMPYHLTTRQEGGGYRVEISVSAPRDWLLQRGFRQEATLRRENGDAVSLQADKRLDVDGPLSVVLTSDASICASEGEMLGKFPELKN